MSWRTKRQVVAILVVLIPILIVGYLVFSRIWTAASCMDNKRNQKEEGIDCGGPCTPCELKNPKPLSVFWTKAVLTRSNTYDVAAQVQNQNETLSSAKIEYEFSLFDELGQAARRAGSTFIIPQDRIYIIENNLVTVREPNRIEFKILKIEWEVKKADRPNIVVEKRDYRVLEESGVKQSMVETSVFNQSSFDFREVEVNFAVFDKDSGLLGVNKVVVEKLPAGSRKTVKSIWPGELGGKPTSIEIDPRVNVLDPSAILKPQ